MQSMANFCKTSIALLQMSVYKGQKMSRFACKNNLQQKKNITGKDKINRN